MEPTNYMFFVFCFLNRNQTTERGHVTKGGRAGLCDFCLKLVTGDGLDLGNISMSPSPCILSCCTYTCGVHALDVGQAWPKGLSKDDLM
jgi:hypothetical protein